MKNNKCVTYDSVSLKYLRLYRRMGLLPYNENLENLSFVDALKSHWPGVYYHVINSIYYTTYLGYGIRMTKQRNITIDYICEFVVIQGLCYRYLVYYLNRGLFIDLVTSCKNLWSHLKPEETTDMLKFQKTVNIIKNFFFVVVGTSVFFFFISALIIRIPPQHANDTAKKILPYKFYVDVQDQPGYALAFLLEFVVYTTETVNMTTVETVGPFLIMMACGYLRVIRNRLISMRNESCEQNPVNADQLSNIDVLNCVKFHQEIMTFCDKIEQYTRSAFMAQIICTVYNISLIGIQLLKGGDGQSRYISLLAISFLQLFFCHWLPEHLINESEAIANAAYGASVMHYHYQRRANRMLLFMMIRAEKPVQLTAGAYIRLSLETFQRMTVSAFSFFTVLRNATL